MKTLCYLRRLLLAYFFGPLIIACHAEPHPLEVFDNVTSEIAFRGWNQQGLGEVVGADHLTVIRSKNTCGDIVILRWSQDTSQFHAEPYTAQQCNERPTEWTHKTLDGEKVLTDQHGQYFLILELVPGATGGQKTERFTLPTPDNVKTTPKESRRKKDEPTKSSSPFAP